MKKKVKNILWTIGVGMHKTIAGEGNAPANNLFPKAHYWRKFFTQASPDVMYLQNKMSLY